MALDKPYTDVPGTIIFDAEQSRKGYWINQFCMSLMKAENRERFKANERAYLDEWPMTEEQKQAVQARAEYRLSLGSLTWPHFLVRGMLAEQLYRVQAIRSGHPYHRTWRP